MQTRYLVLLIGPPCVGKSSWIATHLQEYIQEAYVVINRDDVVSAVAREYGMTYDDMYLDQKEYPIVQEANQEITRRHRENIANAVQTGLSVVIDMTNNTEKSREKMIGMVGAEDWQKMAIVFDTDDDIEFLTTQAELRNIKETELYGMPKTITREILERFLRDFEEPSPDVFHRIVHVRPWWK